MEDRYLIFALIGFATILMVWLPAISKKIKVSYTVLILIIGFLIFSTNISFPLPEPIWKDEWLLYCSEIIVIISIMGAGIKIGNVYALKTWKKPLLLIFITMPLGMLAVFFLGQYFLVLSLPASLLLAAVLSPTDPVLASETQLDDPQREKSKEDSVRFTLTTEAGLNDGAAFPFTYLAVMIGQAGSFLAFNFSEWFWDKLILKVLIGIAVGLFLGYIVSLLLRSFQRITGIKTMDGFLALSLTFLTYGLTELLHGYGFLAVFFAGWSLRYFQRISNRHKKRMNDFINEIERVLLILWLFLFTAALMQGVLYWTSWKGVVFSLIFVLIIRPLTGLIGLAGVKENFKNKLAISFLGIRGIGSVFYLAWAFYEYDGFQEKAELYGIVAYIILFSIILHGLTAPRLINYFRKNTASNKS